MTIGRKLHKQNVSKLVKTFYPYQYISQVHFTWKIVLFATELLMKMCIKSLNIEYLVSLPVAIASSS